MGLLDGLRFAAAQAAGGGRSTQVGVASPWSSGELTRWAAADILGDDVAAQLPVTRAEAMCVPAIVKARSLICGTLSAQPLAVFRGEEKVAPGPLWLTRTDEGAEAPAERMLWTLDDVLFEGVSLWGVDRDSRGQVGRAWRVPLGDWEIDDDLTILVNGRPAQRAEVVLFQGPQEGLLTIARNAVRGDLAMARSWQQRVTSPVPLVELHGTDPTDALTSAEAQELVDAWEVQRRKGGTAYTPPAIELRVHGDKATQLFVEGRNAARLDWANYTALPAALLEGSQASATLTYVTTEGKRSEFVDYSLRYWALPIEARLSMDDVVPRGSRVAFDLQWLSSPAAPAQAPARED